MAGVGARYERNPGFVPNTINRGFPRKLSPAPATPILTLNSWDVDSGSGSLIVQLLLGGAAAGSAAWFSLRYAWWRPARDWRYPRVLMYHMVRDHRPGTRFNKLRVKPTEFARQVQWLAANEFTFVFASQLFSGEALPERCVCLTFDDGYEDNLLNADPVLAECAARATLYLVSDRNGGWSSKKKAHHADDELASEPKLSDDQVRSLLDSRRWELGGHTTTHANLAALSDEDARQEISEARETFRDRFGVQPATFAYPFGIYQPEHAAMAGECGFTGAVTTEPGIAAWPYANPLEVPRIKVSGNDGLLAFKLRIRGGRRGLQS